MKLNKLRKILIESTIWVVLIIFFVVFLVHSIDEKFINKPKHIIKFKDVNGLIVGSPVYYSGVNIGHVCDIDLIDNEAVVTFKIDRKDIELINGTYANIEFKGLAGSKSIELFDAPVNTKEIKSTETIRFATLVDEFSSFMQTIIALSDTAMVFIKDVDEDDAKLMLAKTQGALEVVEKQSLIVEKELEKAEETTAKIHLARQSIAKFLGVEPKKLEMDLEVVSIQLEEFQKKIPLSSKIKMFVKNLASKLSRTKQDVCRFSQEDKQMLKRTLKNVNDMNCGIHQFSKSAKEVYTKENIECVKCKVKEIKTQAIEINENMRMPDGNCN